MHNQNYDDTMGQIRSALRKSTFKPDKEHIAALVDVSTAKDERKKKRTFLCAIERKRKDPIAIKLYVIRAKKGRFYKKKSFLLRDIRTIDGLNPRKPPTTFHINFGKKRCIFDAATVEEREAFLRELYSLAEKYLPAKKPEFVNISIPTVDSTPKHESQPCAAEEEPIQSSEEAEFAKMLSEFNFGISEASRFHEKLVEKLQDLDNTNIDRIVTNEKALNTLIEDLDKCEDNVNFLIDRLKGYERILNKLLDEA